MDDFLQILWLKMLLSLFRFCLEDLFQFHKTSEALTGKGEPQTKPDITVVL